MAWGALHREQPQPARRGQRGTSCHQGSRRAHRDVAARTQTLVLLWNRLLLVVKEAMGQRCKCSTTERGETPMLNLPSAAAPAGLCTRRLQLTATAQPLPPHSGILPLKTRVKRIPYAVQSARAQQDAAEHAETGDDGVCKTLLCPRAALLYTGNTSARCLSWNPQVSILLPSNAVLGLLLWI